MIRFSSVIHQKIRKSETQPLVKKFQWLNNFPGRYSEKSEKVQNYGPSNADSARFVATRYCFYFTIICAFGRPTNRHIVSIFPVRARGDIAKKTKTTWPRGQWSAAFGASFWTVKNWSSWDHQDPFFRIEKSWSLTTLHDFKIFNIFQKIITSEQDLSPIFLNCSLYGH